MSRSVKVAVIGAGVSGLVAARELKREAHNVVVFEKSSRVGGTWLYNPKTESDPLSLDPTREIVHSSLYRSLRTNLPRPLMGFLDYPFRRVERGDPRTFPCHEEVLRFLEEFADEFGINELTRFETEVVKVKKVEEGWVVESRASYGGGDSVSQEVFDSVAVCSGHNVVPRVAEVSGIENWRGFQMHCHNYRVPQPFQGQVVILIGLGPTSFDISREIALVAKEVHVSVKLNPLMKGVKLEDFSNVRFHPTIKCINEDGLVVFEDEVTIYADSIIHCTGYKNQIAFLETNGVVTIDDNRVGPLYKHVFPPTLAPWLSFIGLTYLDPVFPIAELQAKWVARILSGKIVLPKEEEIMKSIQQHYQFIQENGLPKGFTHFLGSFQPPPPAPLFSGLCYYRHRPIRHSLPVSAHLAASLLSSFSPSFILSISVLSSLFSLRVVVSAVVLRLPFIFHFQSSNRASASGTYLTSAIHIIFLEQTRFRLLEPTTKH